MTILKILIDVLGIAGIVIFGSFVLILLADLFLSSIDKREGLFFNKGNKNVDTRSKAESMEELVEEYQPEPAPVEKVAEPVVEEYNPEDESIAVDYKKAEEEEKALNAAVVADFNSEEEEEDELDELTPILKEVTAQALKELEEEATAKEPVVEPEPEPEPEEVVVEEVKTEVKEETQEPEEEKNKKTQALEEKIKKLEEKQDKEDSYKYANIARMNATLNRIRRNTEKLANQEKDKEKEPVAEVVVQDVAPVEEQTEVTVTEEVTMTKPRFQKQYYVDKLNKLQAELKESNAELRAINKEYLPVAKVKKVYDRDIVKLRRKEAIVAKQKLSMYGVNKSGDVDPKKKEKLEANVKELKELKDSIFECEKVIKANEDRFPALEKSHKLVLKQIKRLNDDIVNTKESIEWYDKNTETIVTTTTTTDDGSDNKNE